LAAFDGHRRVRRAIYGEDVTDEAVVGEVTEIRLAPPLRVRLAVAVVGVLVRRDAVVEPAVVERQRDVVVDVEGAVRVVLAHAREPVALGLVAVVLDRVVDRHQADHALVDVGAGVAVHVVVEPEERLLLALVAAGRIGEVELVDPLARLPGRLVGEALEGAEPVIAVVRLAIGLRRGVAVVEVGQERVVRRPEVLAVVAVVLVEMVLEAHERCPAVLRVDPRAGERAVEAVDRAVRQAPRVRVGAPGRSDDLAEAVDRLHL
jgi:hypothetical protein